MTRTDDGYACWKEDPKRVAEARVAAKGIIGARAIKAIIFAPIERFLDGLIAYYEEKRRGQ